LAQGTLAEGDIMLKKMDESAGNVIGFQVIGVLDRADFVTLTEEVQTAIDEAGSAKLLIDFQMYVSEEASGWTADLKFASKYHGKIERLALVGDRKTQMDIADHLTHFYAKQTEFFSVFNRSSAWQWLNDY
jgi:hypothetical protein